MHIKFFLQTSIKKPTSWLLKTSVQNNIHFPTFFVLQTNFTDTAFLVGFSFFKVFICFSNKKKIKSKRWLLVIQAPPQCISCYSLMGKLIIISCKQQQFPCFKISYSPNYINAPIEYRPTWSHTGHVSLLSIHSRMHDKWKWCSHFVIIFGFSSSYSAQNKKFINKRKRRSLNGLFFFGLTH